MSGEQFVMIDLIQSMLELRADNLGTQTQVLDNYIYMYVHVHTKQLHMIQQSIFVILLGATIVTGVYGSGSGPIFMDNTLCFGEETKLLTCLFDSHTADCTHSRDVGVKCYMKGT